MRASEALLEAQVQLAHVNRVATMGELTASIAHDVSPAARRSQHECRRGPTLASREARLTSTERERISSGSPATANKRAK
jgi:C4-dicarboxylate-specific signal transduction histidine kinase